MVGKVGVEKAFIFVVTEVGELAEACEWDDAAGIRGESGDVAFSTVVLHRIGHAAGFIIDDEVPSIEECADSTSVEPSPEQFSKCLRDIGEAILKPKKRQHFAKSCAEMLALAQALAEGEGYDFEKECFAQTVEKCERRLLTGKVVDGAFLKQEDQPEVR